MAKKAKKKSITVTHDDDEDLEFLAESITQVAEGIKRLRKSRLKENTLALLIQTLCPMRLVNHKHKKPTKQQVTDILNAAEDLPRAFLKKRVKGDR